MRILKTLLAGICLALTGNTLAAPAPWLQQSNSLNLGLFVWVSEDCPFTETEASSQIGSEFRKARLTPTDSLELNMTVSVDCMVIESNDNEKMGTAVYVDNRFGTQLVDGSNVLYEEPNNGMFLIVSADEPKSRFMYHIQQSAKDAIKDYVDSNR